MNAVDLSHAGKIIMRCNNRSTLAKYWLSIDNNNNNDNNNDNNNNNKTVVCLFNQLVSKRYYQLLQKLFDQSGAALCNSAAHLSF